MDRCFCGDIHAKATCRHCGAPIMLHTDSGLVGWFARVGRWYSDGDCGRNAMNGFHFPAVRPEVIR